MIKKYKKFLFLLLFGFFFIPKDAFAYDVQAYWASEGWQVQGICQDSQCNAPTGAYVENPSYHCLTILGIEFMGEYKANHRYHNEVRITIPSSNAVAPWQNMTGMDLGFNPYNQTSNFTRTTLSPASPANPQYYPTNWLYRTYDLSYDIVNNSNFNKFGYYFYFDNNNCQKIGGVIIQSYSTTDLDGDKDPNDSIIQNQNKNTSDIINNQNQNQEQTNDRLDSIGDDLTDINDTLNDDSSVSSSDLEDFFEDIPVISSGPISDLLLLPTYILNAIINRNKTTCPAGQYFSIDLPYTDGGLVFTCWTLSDYLDSGTLNTITWILYVVMFYNIAMLVISCWETWTNLSTDFASMYSSKGSSKTGGDK